MKKIRRRVVEVVAYGLAALTLYLASPLIVYGTASLLKVNRGMDNAFADFLDEVYESAQRLTEKWGFYDRYILWCIEITGQT